MLNRRRKSFTENDKFYLTLSLAKCHFDDCQQWSWFHEGNVGFCSRIVLKTDVTSSRDIPEIPAPRENPGEGERKTGEEEEKEEVYPEVYGRSRTGFLRMSFVGSSRARNASLCCIPSGPRTQAQLCTTRTTDSTRANDWRSNPPKLDFNKHPTYLSIYKARLRACKPFASEWSSVNATRSQIAKTVSQRTALSQILKRKRNGRISPYFLRTGNFYILRR